MTIREWRGGASAEQTEAYHSLFVNKLGRSRALSKKTSLSSITWAVPPSGSFSRTVAEVREPLEATFSLNLSAIPEFDRAIARFL